MILKSSREITKTDINDKDGANLPEGIIEGMDLASVEGDVLLGVVGGGGGGSHTLGNGLLHIRGVVLRQRTLFPDAGVALERTLRSIDYVYKSDRLDFSKAIENTFFANFTWVKLILISLGETIGDKKFYKDESFYCFKWMIDNYYATLDNLDVYGYIINSVKSYWSETVISSKIKQICALNIELYIE